MVDDGWWFRSQTSWSCRFIFPTKLGRNVFDPLQGICLRPKKGVRSSTRTPKVARNISYLAMTNMVWLLVEGVDPNSCFLIFPLINAGRNGTVYCIRVYGLCDGSNCASDMPKRSKFPVLTASLSNSGSGRFKHSCPPQKKHYLVKVNTTITNLFGSSYIIHPWVSRLGGGHRAETSPGRPQVVHWRYHIQGLFFRAKEISLIPTDFREGNLGFSLKPI